MRTIAICLFVLCALGCSKESSDEMRSTSIKVLDTETDYLARSIVNLQDGSVIMGSVALEDENGGAAYGSNPSIIAKYNPQGNLEWVIDLPQEVYVLWKCIALDNGNILALGFGDSPNSKNIGVAIISAEGEVLFIESIFNDVPFVLGYVDRIENSVDAIQTELGNILLVMPHQIGSGFLTIPRIIVLDMELSILQDIDYENLAGLEENSLNQLSIAQATDGNVFISGSIYRTSDPLINPFIGIITLSSSLDVVNSKLFSAASTPLDGGSLFQIIRTEIASNIALDASGSPVFVASLRNLGDSLFEPVFNLRDQDIFMRAPQLGLWQITSPAVEDPVKQISGFPANAIIQKIKSTSDGGFIMVGTCGINTNQAISSQYRMLVVKTDGALNVQWIYHPQMQFATLGADVIESAGGYIVTATQYSLGEINKPFFLRLTQSGILQ